LLYIPSAYNAQPSCLRAAHMAVSRSVVITRNSVPFMRLRAAPSDPEASNFHPIMAFRRHLKTFLKGRYESLDSLQNIGGGHVDSVLVMSWVSFFEIFAGVHFPSPINGNVVFVSSKKANCHSTRMVDGTQVAIDLRVCYSWFLLL
jgi:hypothetical protein